MLILNLCYIITKNRPTIGGEHLGHGGCDFVIIHINLILEKKDLFVNVNN